MKADLVGAACPRVDFEQTGAVRYSSNDFEIGDRGLASRVNGTRATRSGFGCNRSIASGHFPNGMTMNTRDIDLLDRLLRELRLDVT